MRAAKHCFDTRRQFARAEWLGDVIVGADFQTQDAVDLCGSRSEQDNGRRLRATDISQEIEAVNVRQADIEDDQVYLALVENRPCRQAGGHADGVESFALQNELDVVRDSGLILNDENSVFHDSNVTPRSKTGRQPSPMSHAPQTLLFLA